MSKIFRATFEDYRNPDDLIKEHHFILADCLKEVSDELHGEGEGYDKELIEIVEVIPAVRFLRKAKQ